MLINLLGPMQVTLDDGGHVDVGGAKQRAVLAQLARSPNAAVPLDLLAEGIWGTGVPPRYRQNLQVYVSTLRRALEPHRAGKTPSRIVGHREAYELLAADEEIDVRRFESGLRAGRDALHAGRPEAAASLIASALEEWRGTPLADLADQPFAGDWTTQLLEERTAALEDRIAADLARGRSTELVAELQALVREFPERERLWQHLMLALYRCGRQSEALETYRQARDILLEETGLDPGLALTETADRILRHDPSLQPVAPVTAESASVPVPLTPVIGAPDALDEALALLERHERLVVLTGPGGVGKTRLALAAAEDLTRTGRDVVWVPLEDVTTADAAITAIAQRLQVADDGDLASSLAGRSEVLLLDNLEQVADLAVPVRQLVEAAPGIQILATSRSPLGLLGERVVEVPPLDPGTAAVELFAERARSTYPAFDLDGCRPDVARICAALDGLPLAIELASARTAMFTVTELAGELVADPGAVDTGTTGGRQGSLRGLVGWSLRLLSDPTRHLLERLAVCPASFDLDTALAIAALVDLTPSQSRLAVAELVRGSLLRVVEEEAGRRFTMLNTIRTVAAGPLTPAERSRVADALADLWVSRAAAPDETAQPDQKRIAATRADLPITRWVHAHLLATDRGDDAARVALGNRRVYATLGIANEALDCLVELLDAGSLSPSWVPRVRVAAGRCAYVCRDPRADAFLAAVEDLDERDFVYRVQAHSGLCASFADAGESVGALAEARLALEAAGASGDPALQRLALSAAGWAALRREAYDDAAAHARAQLALAETDADTALALSDVALAELFRESTDAALEAAGEALRLAWRQGQGTPVSQAQQQLGYALVQADDAASALPLLLSCLRSSPQHHDAGFTLETVASVGLAAAMLGERERGRQLIRECNAVTQALFDGELAISEPLRTAAAAHEIDISHEEDRVLPLRSTTDLVDEALALGEQLQMIGSK